MQFKLKPLYILITLIIGLGLIYWILGSNKEGLEGEINNVDETTTQTDTTTTDTTTTETNSDNTTSVGANNNDNYNHYDGSSIPSMFYGPNGSVAKILKQNNEYSVIVTNSAGQNTTYNNQNTPTPSLEKLAAAAIKVISSINNARVSNEETTMRYYGPNNSVAVLYSDVNGNKAIKVIDDQGGESVYSAVNIQTYNPAIDNQPDSETTMNDYQEAYNSNPINTDNGIPKSMIPPGQEDLYILKTQVVPPVCPACPKPILKCDNDKPPPPCPPCARCPEPKFDCKKVPNYGTGNIGANYYGGGNQGQQMMTPNGESSNFLPYPSSNDYTTFGN